MLLWKANIMVGPSSVDLKKKVEGRFLSFKWISGLKMKFKGIMSVSDNIFFVIKNGRH